MRANIEPMDLTSDMTSPASPMEQGRAARRVRPRSTLAELSITGDRDPVAIISADDADRLEWLLPERYRRMSVSPFTFFRGSASIMARDLGGMPNSGLVTQLCGDAHLGNFGMYASPERSLLFDVNDFDETHPGPFEWDVQRLATSCVLAARESGFATELAERAASSAATQYQTAMLRYAQLGELELWYQRVQVDDLLAMAAPGRVRDRVEKATAKARRRDAASAVAKLTEMVDGQHRFRDDPPLLLRLTGVTDNRIEEGRAEYRSTLSPDHRHLLDRFEVVDLAHKVVGVGSVGTRCLVVLLVGHTCGEPLILQFKEAGTSVLEPYTAPSAYEHAGERVVSGQRMMQSASDIFLGWTTSLDSKQFYWRQLRDMKYSPELSELNTTGLVLYAGLCGQALARAHARGGNRVAIASYLGKGPTFARAITTFSMAAADLAERDHQRMIEALVDGRLPTTDVPLTGPVVRGAWPESTAPSVPSDAGA